MDRVNALLIEKLERLHAECVGARPDDGGARDACRTALTGLYWGLTVLLAGGDAAIAMAALYFGVGFWSIWGAVAIGCLSALAFYAVTGAVRRRIEAF